MKNQSVTHTLTVDQTPEEVYAAINHVRGWWTGKPGIEGNTDKLGDEFTFRYEPQHFSRQKVTELIPAKRIAWLVLASEIIVLKDQDEWTGTKMIFDIAGKGDKTEVRFTHQGLTPEVECFNSCLRDWGGYIHISLRKLMTRMGKAHPKEKAVERR